MLKIAEYNKADGHKIELEELEKFGFDSGTIHKWCNDDCYVYDYPFKSIYIDSKTRIVNFDDEWFGDDFYKMDVVYDLITAGYVEKCEVRNEN